MKALQATHAQVLGREAGTWRSTQSAAHQAAATRQMDGEKPLLELRMKGQGE